MTADWMTPVGVGFVGLLGLLVFVAWWAGGGVRVVRRTFLVLAALWVGVLLSLVVMSDVDPVDQAGVNSLFDAVHIGFVGVLMLLVFWVVFSFLRELFRALLYWKHKPQSSDEL